MTSYIMYDILKPSVFWKIWRMGFPYIFLFLLFFCLIFLFVVVRIDLQFNNEFSIFQPQTYG